MTKTNTKRKRGGSINIKNLIAKHKSSKKNKDYAIGKLSGDTRNTEVDLLNMYEKFTATKNKYLQSYEEHRRNLKLFDTKLGSGSSFVKFFDEFIMPSDILSGDPIDRKNPLLINDYFVYNDSTLKDLKIQHIKQQIRYVYYKHFDKHTKHLLKDLAIKDISPTSVKIEFIGRNNKQYFRDCPIDKFILNETTLQEIIPDVSEKITNNVNEYVSEVAQFEAKKKLDAEAKALKVAEDAKAAENQMRVAMAQAEMAKFKPRGAFAPPPADAFGRDFGAAAAAAASPKQVEGAVPITSPVIPKLDLSAGPIKEDEDLKALLGNKKKSNK